MNTSIILKDLVLIGGGHAHVHTIKMFGMNPIPGVRVTLISRDVDTPYSGMLPGQVAGIYSHDECHIDLVRLTSFASIRFLHCEASGIDLDNKKILCNDDRPPISFDVLSIDIGITPKPLGNGMSKFSNITAVKPIDRFSMRWETIKRRLLENTDFSASKPMRIVVVGGGAGGCELSFAIHYRLCNELYMSGKNLSVVQIILVTKNDKILSGHSKRAQHATARIMAKKGIQTIFNCDIVGCIESDVSSPLPSDKHDSADARPVVNSRRASQLIDANGLQIDFDECFWCTQASAQSWLKDSGLATTEDGFVSVSATLESINTPGVFACGDIAELTESPRPKAGVFAVRAGPPLTRNLRAKLLSSPLERWIPQDQFLGLIGTFGKGMPSDPHWGAYAIGSKAGLALEGEYLWHLKDKIDRNFMDLFSILPDKEEMMKKMNGQQPTTDIAQVAATMDNNVISLLAKAQMRCGGCGSKVGSTILSRVLKQVQKSVKKNPLVISGVGGGDDAAVVCPPPSDCYSVHTIDYFRSFLSDPFIFGKIAANHALSDAFAMNADATSALALCVIPYGAEEKVESELLHMLAGCVSVLESVNCSLVGGHTSEGMEPALGLSVNGSAHPSTILRKGPLKAGDAIILTKGLGTGTIMAADMRAKAKGPWVLGTLQSMLASNKVAAGILRSHGCLAATDVTGFGFMGHLLEMIKFEATTEESSCCVTINVADVPFLPGAVECIQNGILSSLQPQNVRSARAVGNTEYFSEDPRYPLLFDPQTSGGLLAAVPQSSATSALQALHAAGYSAAAIIGSVESTSSESSRSNFRISYLDVKDPRKEQFSVWLM